MSNKIYKIVLLEENKDDADSIIAELKKSKISHEIILVSNKESFKKALIDSHPDLILAETIVSGMEVNEAMDIYRELSPSSSIILLTVSLDKQLSVEHILEDPKKYLDLQRSTKLKAVIKTSIDILNVTEEINRMDKELKRREALLTATLESTADGILVVDNDGKIVSYNQNFVKMWNIPNEIINSGQDNKALAYVVNQIKEPQAFLKRVHELYNEDETESYDMVNFIDGKVFERYSKPQKIDGNTVGRVWSFRDVSEAKFKDEKLKASLREKEMMLREIHHRVKNNLQIVSSLLKLQSSYTKDPDAAEHLRISQNRVRTMAMIHEKLYGSQEMSNIEFGSFIRQLVNHIFNSFGVNQDNIELKIRANDVYLDIDTAVPCGLLINEIVSNSLKHAFPNNNGKIEIDLYIDNKKNYNLCISDDGIGLPIGINSSSNNSLGLTLIHTLAKQLESELIIDADKGTKYSLKFRPILYLERK